MLNVSEMVRDTDTVTIDYGTLIILICEGRRFDWLEWLSEIFSNTKHRAVCLRQLSFLLKKRLTVT